MNNLMLDIETLGTGTDAVITQIGACYFDRVTGGIDNTMLINCSIEDQIRDGRIVDDATLRWWFSQSPTFFSDPVPLKQALENVTAFAQEAQYVWCHATFDVPIIDHAFKMYGVPLPWHYTHVRDIRTLADLAGGEKPKTKNKKTHSALDDCLHQVEYCSVYFNRIANKQHE